MAEEIKYINADELHIKLNTTRSPESKFGGDDYTDGFDAGIWEAMEIIKTMPNADVVPVVRCKDCRYNNTNHCPAYVDNPNGDDYQLLEGYSYCSYGERKEFYNGKD